jgi:hypothetical protein
MAGLVPAMMLELATPAMVIEIAGSEASQRDRAKSRIDDRLNNDHCAYRGK